MRTFCALLKVLGLEEPDTGLKPAKAFIERMDRERTHQTINARAFRVESTRKFIHLISKLLVPPVHDPSKYTIPSAHQFVQRMEIIDPETTEIISRQFGVIYDPR